MRKITAGLFMSLDGVVGSPERWQMPYYSDELGAVIGASMAEADTMLLGRRTYEEFAHFFTHDGAAMPTAGYMNATPKLVASTTLETADWQNSTLIKGDVAAELARLKEGPGKNIAISGSGTLVRSLLRDGLLDELTLLVHPVIVGRGQRLFADDGEQRGLRLAASQPLGNGVVVLTYTPAAAPIRPSTRAPRTQEQR